MGGVDSLPGGCYWWQPYCPKRIILPRTIRNPKFQRGLGVAALTAFLLIGIFASSFTQQVPSIRLAMIGNSMMYYNDFPRFLEALSDHSIEQDSCLHGDATLHSILITGSGTYKVWRTGVARIHNASVELYHEDRKEDEQFDDDNFDFTRLYDYGACTVPQLLFGYDKNLDEKMDGWSFEQSYESHGDDVSFTLSAFSLFFHCQLQATLTNLPSISDNATVFRRR